MSLYTIAGLPIHPLVVHFAVVLLPLSTLSIMAAIYSPRFHQRYFKASLLGTFLGLGAAFVAKESGEALAKRVGLPVRHADYGTYLVIAAFVFLVATFLWNFLQNKNRTREPGVVGNGAALLGIVVLALTFLTGHSGAQAVWEAKIKALDSAQNSTVESGAAAKIISISEVEKNSSASSCWSIVNGNVYDLTKWIDRHPGGAAVIKSMCGKDASAGFKNQHNGQGKPESELARYKIGVLG